MDAEQINPPAAKSFNYDKLNASDRAACKRHADAIRLLAVRSTASILEIGRRLQIVHDHLNKRGFVAWCDAEFQWSSGTAYKLMRCARAFADVDHADNLAPTALYALMFQEADSPAIREAIERAKDGELITGVKAREIRDRHRAEPFKRTLVEPRFRLRYFVRSLARKLDPEQRVALADTLRELAEELTAGGIPAEAAEAAGK